MIQPIGRPSEAFEIDQLRRVIHHLNAALARCHAILAELEQPTEHMRDIIESKRLQ